MTKRFYEVDETVWIKPLKGEGVITKLDIPNLEATVKVEIGEHEGFPVFQERTFKFMEIDKHKDLNPKLGKKYSPNEMFFMVKYFHQKFKHPASNVPQAMTTERAVDRMGFKGEEIVEFLHASCDNEHDFSQAFNAFLIKLSGAVAKLKSVPFPESDFDRLVAQVDALTDTSYFNNGDFVEIGVKPYNAFKIVQEANMGKLWEDGEPRYDAENGNKIMKPANWERDFAPEKRLRQEVERQIQEAQSQA